MVAYVGDSRLRLRPAIGSDGDGAPIRTGMLSTLRPSRRNRATGRAAGQHEAGRQLVQIAALVEALADDLQHLGPHGFQHFTDETAAKAALRLFAKDGRPHRFILGHTLGQQLP